MKKYLVLVFALFLASVSQAQTVKTTEGKRLAELEKEIAAISAERDAASNNLAELLVKYSTEHIKVKELKAQLEKLNETLLPLELERKGLLKKQLVTNLPNNNIELLKMIVIQNERIIELLENLTLKPNF